MKSKAKKDKTGGIMESGQPSVAADQPDHIATAAYYKAESRGFAPGREMDDWLAAEAECVDRKQASLHS